MRIVFKISLVLVIAIGGLLGYVALKPAQYEIAREISIGAPPEVIFAYVNNLKEMDRWNAFIAEDPKVNLSYRGPDNGIGAQSLWSSPGKMGEGSATIVLSIPRQLVVTRIEYIKPPMGVQTGEISLTVRGQETVVRWSVKGENSFMNRLAGLFVSTDTVVGDVFERSLNKLKYIVEVR